MHNYILNIALDICLKTFIRVKNEMDHIVGRISVNEIGPESCDVYLYLTKSDDMLPVIEIDVHLADTGWKKMKLLFI